MLYLFIFGFWNAWSVQEHNVFDKIPRKSRWLTDECISLCDNAGQCVAVSEFLECIYCFLYPLLQCKMCRKHKTNKKTSNRSRSHSHRQTFQRHKCSPAAKFPNSGRKPGNWTEPANCTQKSPRTSGEFETRRYKLWGISVTINVHATMMAWEKFLQTKI